MDVCQKGGGCEGRGEGGGGGGVFALDRSECGVDQTANATRANSLVASRLQSGVTLLD